MDRANLHSGDTFARLDALAAARAAIERAEAGAEGAAPWVAGRITLGAYDLERQVWPVNGLTLALPTGDRMEEAVARRVQPDIDTRALSVPMSVEEARDFDATRTAARRRSGPLEFYARIDMGPPRRPDRLAASAQLRELFLFLPQGSPSQPMRVSPAFDRDTAIALLEFEAPAAPESPAVPSAEVSAPASETPSAVTAPRTEARAVPPATPQEPEETWPDTPDLDVARSEWDMLGLQTGMTFAQAQAVLAARDGIVTIFERPRPEPDPASVRATLYQRMYIAADGTEAITLAAPGPDGPVLAILRRLQLPRGDLPFDTIRQSLIDKYGLPAIENAASEGSKMYWFDGTPGAAQAICRVHFPRRIDLREWHLREGGDSALDLSQPSAAWNWAIADMPVDYAEQATRCGRVLTFEPEGAAQQGGAAFSMMLLDIGALRIVDETLSGVPAAEDREIDF
ncbi:hypothetical protein [Jannaschia marina]|uniref:hypothetical protein n=1 Tax=Jannaschia marina TaxID=2741674 RepID=UPI0015CA5744|nr:hypothetical protein [Jannaschia marina]